MPSVRVRATLKPWLRLCVLMLARKVCGSQPSALARASAVAPFVSIATSISPLVPAFAAAGFAFASAAAFLPLALRAVVLALPLVLRAAVLVVFDIGRFLSGWGHRVIAGPSTALAPPMGRGERRL